MTKGVTPFLKLPDSEDTVRLLRLLRLLLLDSDKVDRLDSKDRRDWYSDPDLDPKPYLEVPFDPGVRPVTDDQPDPAVRPDLDVCADLEDKEDTSERSDRDGSSKMDDSLVLEVTSDTSEEAVVGLFFSRSGCSFTLITLNKQKKGG